MTWKEIKDKIESLEVKNESEIEFIDIWDSSESDKSNTIIFSCGLNEIIVGNNGKKLEISNE